MGHGFMPTATHPSQPSSQYPIPIRMDPIRGAGVAVPTKKLAAYNQYVKWGVDGSGLYVHVWRLLKDPALHTTTAPGNSTSRGEGGFGVLSGNGWVREGMMLPSGGMSPPAPS